MILLSSPCTRYERRLERLRRRQRAARVIALAIYVTVIGFMLGAVIASL